MTYIPLVGLVVYHLPASPWRWGEQGLEIWSWSFPPPGRDERRKPHLHVLSTSPSTGIHCDHGPMPGRGMAPRSDNVLVATLWCVPSPSFLDELARERWGSEGLPQPGHVPERLLQVSSPLGVAKQPRSSGPSVVAAGCPSSGTGGGFLVCGSVPRASWQDVQGSCPLEPLPTLLLLLALFQAHSSSPAWESSCCPEPTATILYKVIFPLSAENNTEVIPSYQRFQKKPNTSLARFRFNLIISLKRGFVLFVSFVFWKKKKSFFFPFCSDLCLKVNNVLSHQGDGGPCFLPLYSF